MKRLLSLSAVYAIVRDHNGFIKVETERGRGTTFRIYLPVRLWDDVGSGISQVPEQQAKESQKFCETILFVEDEKHQATLMGGFLQKKGFRVLIARDGVEAVEIYSKHKDEIATMVLDMSLPKLSGWEAFLRMKQIQPEIRAIFATGYINPDERQNMVSQGAVEVLQKPYLPEELLQEIRTTLSKRAHPHGS